MKNLGRFLGGAVIVLGVIALTLAIAIVTGLVLVPFLNVTFIRYLVCVSSFMYFWELIIAVILLLQYVKNKFFGGDKR